MGLIAGFFITVSSQSVHLIIMVKQITGSLRVRPMLPRSAKQESSHGYDKSVGKLKEASKLKPVNPAKKAMRVGPKAQREEAEKKLADDLAMASGWNDHKVSRGKHHRETFADEEMEEED